MPVSIGPRPDLNLGPEDPPLLRKERPMDPISTISRAALAQGLRDLTGIDPDRIHSVYMTPEEITVECYVVNEDGQFVSFTGQDVATERITIEVTP